MSDFPSDAFYSTHGRGGRNHYQRSVSSSDVALVESGRNIRLWDSLRHSRT